MKALVGGYEVSGPGSQLLDESGWKALFESHWPFSSATGSLVLVPISSIPTTGTVWSSRGRNEAERLVREIQAKLSLTIGEIARALAVSRQAVHSWMRGGAIDPLNRKNLEQLHGWARKWAERSGNRFPDTGGWVPVRGGSILDVVAKAGASSQEGRRAWEEFVAGQLEALERRARIPSGQELLDRMGAPMPSKEGQKRTLRRNLGRI